MDVLTKKQRCYNMSRIKGKDTGPEILLRRFLYSQGCRGYRLNGKLSGKPDIVFNKNKLAIFIDGCFWHKCPKCFVIPKTRTKFWTEKINNNVKRDKNINAALKKEGWSVVRIWEHEIKESLEKSFNKISRYL